MKAAHIRLEAEGKISASEMTELLESIMIDIKPIVEDFLGDDESMNIFYRVGEGEEECLEVTNE
jgi:hypothetical protein